jgi:hypothetical protein
MVSEKLKKKFKWQEKLEITLLLEIIFESSTRHCGKKGEFALQSSGT